MGKRFLRCSADRLAFEKQQGPSEGQQEPGSTVRRSISTRKLHNRVKSCSYTNIRRNKSLCLSHGRPKQGTHETAVIFKTHRCWKYLVSNSEILIKKV